MARLAVICLPDLILAVPTVDTGEKESTLAPTRSFIKDAFDNLAADPKFKDEFKDESGS